MKARRPQFAIDHPKVVKALEVILAAEGGIRSIDLAGALCINYETATSRLRPLREAGLIASVNIERGKLWMSPDKVAQAKAEQAVLRHLKLAQQRKRGEERRLARLDALLETESVHRHTPVGGYPRPTVTRPFSIFNLQPEAA